MHILISNSKHFYTMTLFWFLQSWFLTIFYSHIHSFVLKFSEKFINVIDHTGRESCTT